MNCPRHPQEYDHNFYGWEELEDDVIAVLDRTTAAVWKRAEALAAITSLIDDIDEGDPANAETQCRTGEGMKRLWDRRKG
ncbi:hypothetical protein [Paracoccus laeviglucosivorans]|uniref:Uncharacterized protein n=1 Tax=Paracoccus laeviglucosivorans TaxID=1197861 RepID=A0A521CXE3_9RHOB|nr:hypothetical protein [Paracoccus laeviglucosivorans]SMO64136.1 hypothetical protein SAMN06265221_105264 [Paracoccus laeviglucosivorans]